MREYDALLARAQVSIERADLRAGIIASTIANVFRGKGGAFKPQDFMPSQEKPQKKRSSQDLLQTVEMLNAAFGGKDDRDRTTTS